MTFLDKTIMKPFVWLTPKWLTPNQITAFRVFLVPIVIWLLIFEDYGIGGVVFAVAAFSDAVDGAVARTRNQVTEFGKMFDPIADKLLIIGVGAIMMLKFMPPLIFLAIVFLELVIMTIALFNKYRLHLDIQANVFGKIKMILQSVGIILIFVYAVFYAEPLILKTAYYLLFAAITCALCSLFYDRVNV